MSKTIAFSDEYTVEHLGEQELDVYDLEVENDHNFFGNDICLHNSLYIRFDELVKKVFGDISYSDIKNKQKIIKFLKKVSDDKIVPLFDKAYEELFKQQNAYINTMSMKREIIADVGIFRKKKNYILSVWDSEGG